MTGNLLHQKKGLCPSQQAKGIYHNDQRRAWSKNSDGSGFKVNSSRIVPVGRLDRPTTGLLLFTNDGDLAKKLTHPSSFVKKLYHVVLSRSLKPHDLAQIRRGFTLNDGAIKVDEVSYVQGASKREIGLEIHSGRNRIVRRIFEHLGYEVIALDRVVFAGLTKKTFQEVNGGI